eukprot:6200065-Pleurochrysis_carterae.AAC.2
MLRQAAAANVPRVSVHTVQGWRLPTVAPAPTHYDTGSHCSAATPQACGRWHRPGAAGEAGAPGSRGAPSSSQSLGTPNRRRRRISKASGSHSRVG